MRHEGPTDTCKSGDAVHPPVVDVSGRGPVFFGSSKPHGWRCGFLARRQVWASHGNTTSQACYSVNRTSHGIGEPPNVNGEKICYAHNINYLSVSDCEWAEVVLKVRKKTSAVSVDKTKSGF